MTVTEYAKPPADPPKLEECKFYHTIDLPGVGLQEGEWDLRPGIDRYLGSINVSGKRVLEIGTANGFVCFELESRGAEVVAFDLADGLTYDAIPSTETRLGRDTYCAGLRRIKNAYWLGHRLLGSRARVAYGHANALPEFLGRFDIAVLANVLQHLKDPVGAVMQAARIAEVVVVTEADWWAGRYDDLQGMIFFGGDHLFSWYQVKPPLIKAVLSRMGFGECTVEFHTQTFLKGVTRLAEAGPVGQPRGIQVPHFTVIGKRSVAHNTVKK